MSLEDKKKNYETFRRFCVFVFMCRTKKENAELSETFKICCILFQRVKSSKGLHNLLKYTEPVSNLV